MDDAAASVDRRALGDEGCQPGRIGLLDAPTDAAIEAPRSGLGCVADFSAFGRAAAQAPIEALAFGIECLHVGAGAAGPARQAGQARPLHRRQQSRLGDARQRRIEQEDRPDEFRNPVGRQQAQPAAGTVAQQGHRFSDRGNVGSQLVDQPGP
jgi:hypothetical protein